MLKQRVITALVLLAVLLPALFYESPLPFCGIALLLIAAGAWEWGRLNGCAQGVALAFASVCIAACAVSWWLGLLTQSLPLLWSLVAGY